MDQMTFADEMTKRGFTAVEKAYYGEFEEFPVTVGFINGKPGGKTNFTIWMIFNKQQLRAGPWKKVAKQVKGKASLRTIPYNDHRVTPFRITLKNDDDLGFVFDTLITGFAQLAREKGLTPPENCPVCNRPGCDSYAAMAGRVFTPVHAYCLQTTTTAKMQQVQQNEEGGNRALGILGAVLGALVGAIPTVLVVVLFESIYAILCALIPLGSYYGYKLLGGKMDRVVLPVVVVASVLMVPVVYYMAQMIWLWNDVAYFLSPAEFFSILLMYPEEVISEMATYFLFTGIGIFFAYGSISRNNKHTWNEASFAAATLRPMQGITQQVQAAAMRQPAPQAAYTQAEQPAEP